MNDNCILGFEFSGRKKNGKRVAAFCLTRGIATASYLHPNLQFDVPDNWSMEEAATVPVVYATSYYALIIRGNLQPGQSVLIHSGTGGVGQAAINIALSMNCEIFTTVGKYFKIHLPIHLIHYVNLVLLYLSVLFQHIIYYEIWKKEQK